MARPLPIDVQAISLNADEVVPHRLNFVGVEGELQQVERHLLDLTNRLARDRLGMEVDNGHPDGDEHPGGDRNHLEGVLRRYRDDSNDLDNDFRRHEEDSDHLDGDEHQGRHQGSNYSLFDRDNRSRRQSPSPESVSGRDRVSNHGLQHIASTPVQSSGIAGVITNAVALPDSVEVPDPMVIPKPVVVSGSSKNSFQNLPSYQNTNCRPETYSGETDMNTWLVHFDLIAEINRWEGEIKAKFMGSSLRKEALRLYASLSKEVRKDPVQIASELRNRFAPCDPVQSYRLQLRQRRRKVGESLSTVATAIRVLAAKAYPEAPKSTLEDIAVDHFVEALEDNRHLRMLIRRSKPATLSEALATARFEEGIMKVDDERNPLAHRAATLQPYDASPSPESSLVEGDSSIAGASGTSSSSVRPSSLTDSSSLKKHTDGGSSDRPKVDYKELWQMEVDRRINCLQEERDDLKEKVRTLLELTQQLKDTVISERNRPRQNQRPRLRSEIRCYHCSLYGHYKWECPHLVEPRARPNLSSMDGNQSGYYQNSAQFSADRPMPPRGPHFGSWNQSSQPAQSFAHPAQSPYPSQTQYSSSDGATSQGDRHLSHPAESVASVRDGYFVGSPNKTAEATLNASRLHKQGPVCNQPNQNRPKE